MYLFKSFNTFFSTLETIGGANSLIPFIFLHCCGTRLKFSEKASESL